MKMNPSKTSYPTFLIVTAVYNLVFLVVFLVIFYIWNYTEFNGSGLSYKTGELIGMIGAGVMTGVLISTGAGVMYGIQNAPYKWLCLTSIVAGIATLSLATALLVGNVA